MQADVEAEIMYKHFVVWMLLRTYQQSVFCGLALDRQLFAWVLQWEKFPNEEEEDHDTDDDDDDDIDANERGLEMDERIDPWMNY